MLKTDLILELNIEIRRIKEVPQSIKAIKISYSIKKTILILFLDKIDAYELLNKHRNRLIKVVKAVNILITNIKIVIK